MAYATSLDPGNRPAVNSIAPGFSPETQSTQKVGASAPYRFSISFLLLTLFLLSQPLRAQDHSNFFPILGGQRAGTSAFTFLKIGVGARALGMGGAYIPVANDATTLFWNPAGLVQIAEKRSITADHNEWVAGIQHENLGIVWQFGGIYGIGLSASALHMDPMEITTEYQPGGTGAYFNYGDVMAGLSFAMKMTDRFSFGITGKLVDEQLAEHHMVNTLFDLGTYYYTGFQQLRFAVALVNFGTPAAPKGEYTYTDVNDIQQTEPYADFAPPTIFRLGIANEWLNSPHAQFTTSVQLNHPVDNAENISWGAEFSVKEMLYLRGGYQSNMDVETWSVGLGIHLAMLQVDYAYTDMRDWNNAQRFSLGWAF